MLAGRFPRKYFPVAIVTVFTGAFNWLRPTAWGSKFLSGEHVAWIAGLLISLVVGMLYADLLKANSDLRRWWRYRARLFDVVSLKRWPYEDAQGRHERITLCVRFVRRVRDASVHLRVEVPGWSLPKTLDLLSNISKAKGSELTVVVGVAHITTQPVLRAGEKSHDTHVSVTWGNPEQGSADHFLPMGGPSRAFAAIFIEAGRQQTFAIYAETFADSPYFITDEDHELLAL